MNDETTALVPLSGSLAPFAAGGETARRAAADMARIFQEATAEIGRLMAAIRFETRRVREAFRAEDAMSQPGFGISYEYNGHRYLSADDADRLTAVMARDAWRVLFNHLGIASVMSVAQRKEFARQLETGEGLPPLTEDSILSILGGLAARAEDFARDAVKEVFDFLRPNDHYKTNEKFLVGRRVVLSWSVEECYGGGRFRVNYVVEPKLTALDGVFHVLDGKGVLRDGRNGPLITAIQNAESGRGETPYFRFKCFKNRNLHLEFCRLDLVRRLNLLGAGEDALGMDR